MVTGGETGRTRSGIVAWGSYDSSKPRVRLLLDRLREEGALRDEINISAWSGVRDKAVMGPLRLAWTLVRLIASYPGALMRLARQPSRGNILLAYPAIPDIFVMWPLARLRRHRIIFDAFIPLHDTVVGDRKMVRRNSLLARLLWAVEKLALRMADIVVVDTDEQGQFFAREFDLDPQKLVTILVGAEPIFWKRKPVQTTLPTAVSVPSGASVVLFYGQLIPLHGIATILEAARATAGEKLHWVLVGSGQDEPLVRRFLEREPGDNVSWIEWIDYGDLPDLIASATVALGIFGTSDKAARVIPNKVFQIMAAGRPVITRSGPAADRLVRMFPQSLVTVSPGDAPALAAAVREAVATRDGFRPVPLEAELELGPAAGVRSMLGRLGDARRLEGADG